jgi:hypothetical protein
MAMTEHYRHYRNVVYITPIVFFGGITTNARLWKVKMQLVKHANIVAINLNTMEDVQTVVYLSVHNAMNVLTTSFPQVAMFKIAAMITPVKNTTTVKTLTLMAI